MNPIEILSKYKHCDQLFYYKYINDFKTFNISKSNIREIVKKIKNENAYEYNEIIRKFLYFIFRLTQSNDYIPVLLKSEKGIPTNGYEFINKKENKGLGIYHVHLHNNSVLIWYYKIHDYGTDIVFEYHSHPIDGYRKILSDIYSRDDGGYNFKECIDFFNNTYLLYESMITKFKNFIDRII